MDNLSARIRLSVLFVEMVEGKHSPIFVNEQHLWLITVGRWRGAYVTPVERGEGRGGREK